MCIFAHVLYLLNGKATGRKLILFVHSCCTLSLIVVSHFGSSCTCKFIEMVPCFSVQYKGPGEVILVMTSRSAGYFVFGGNVSENDTGPWWSSIFVPAKHSVMFSMISYILLKSAFEINVGVYVCTNNYDRSVEPFEFPLEICARISADYELPYVYYFPNSYFVVTVSRNYPPFKQILSGAFRLFFSTLLASKMPQKLTSGLWNCSVDHYSIFEHHVACNLNTECEDGRDETEHCPFSSADCQGMVALCGRCYKFVRRYRGYEGDGNKADEELCHLFGGMLSFPTCLYDPYNALANSSKRHWDNLDSIGAGLYLNDLSNPNIYRHSVYNNDKTVFHHSLILLYRYDVGENDCVLLSLPTMEISAVECINLFPYDRTAAICEVKINRTEISPSHSKIISSPYTPVWMSMAQNSMTVCRDGHVTHTFLLCGSIPHKVCGDQYIPPCHYFNQTSSIRMLESTDGSTTLIPTFTCSDEFTTSLSYSLICDFITDCQNDESFCEHPVCHNTMFTCANGQCVPYDKMCDQISHCQDESDERNCYALKPVHIPKERLQPHVLVNFDGISQFTTTQMNANESCPDSHYLCPGEFHACLPMYTRCNGMYDCRQHEDEEGCTDMKCPGFFRCRFSLICVHNDNICDGWPHCPMNDDELVCDVTCPAGCLCQVHSFLCPQPFHAAPFPHIRSVDATGSGLTPYDVSSNVYLIRLVLVRCSLTKLPEMKLLNLRLLDVSNNKLQHVNMSSFSRLENLLSLSLSDNPIWSLSAVPSSVNQRSSLTMIDLSHTVMAVFDSKVFAQLSSLQKLNLTSTSIHTISNNGFQYTPQLTELYMKNSPVKTFPPDIFKYLPYLHFISTQNYKLCCDEILPDKFDTSSCHAPSDEISSCEDLLQSWTYRGFLWLIACLTVSGNVFCFCARSFAKRKASSSGFSVFVTSLTLADFLMGVYLAVIGVADESFRGRYLHHDDAWKQSVTCQVAGFLSLLSCEVSALIICLITVDRFIVLCFPFSTLRFERRSATVVCVLIWLVGCVFALVPLLPVTSHWEFYSQTGICIPLPVTRQEFKGKVYSFGVLIVLNFVLFLVISLGQAFIYWTIESNVLKTNSTKVAQDTIIARRLITIALTDFLCWFPIGLCGILASIGIPITGEVNVSLAIFVLPLNSTINPFMYTFNTLAEKRRKFKESKLLKWLESRVDLIAS